MTNSSRPIEVTCTDCRHALNVSGVTTFRFPGAAEVFSIDMDGPAGARHLLRLAAGRDPGAMRGVKHADGTIWYRSRRKLAVRSIIQLSNGGVS